MTEPTVPPGTKPSFNFNDFISFRFLITPAMITIVYVIGLVLISIIGLAAMIGPSGVVAGLAILVFGNLYWRILLEFVVVIFKVNDSLQSIERRGRGM